MRSEKTDLNVEIEVRGFVPDDNLFCAWINVEIDSFGSSFCISTPTMSIKDEYKPYAISRIEQYLKQNKIKIGKTKYTIKDNRQEEVRRVIGAPYGTSACFETIKNKKLIKSEVVKAFKKDIDIVVQAFNSKKEGE